MANAVGAVTTSIQGVFFAQFLVECREQRKEKIAICTFDDVIRILHHHRHHEAPEGLVEHSGRTVEEQWKNSVSTV
jgi:hypothetical protein